MSEEIKNTVNRTEKSANAAKIIIAVALALLIAAAAFTAGFFTGNCAVSDYARSLDWLLKTIEENYYFYDDFDADGAGDVLVSGTYGGTTTQFTDKAAFAEFMEKVGDNESFTLSTKESDFTVARQEYKASYTFMATCESAGVRGDGGRRAYSRREPCKEEELARRYRLREPFAILRHCG